MKIESVEIKEILDSQDRPTLEVKVNDQSAKLPRGKSTGKHEAPCLSTEEAQSALDKLNLIGQEFSSISELENAVPENCNLKLGLGIAFSRSLAKGGEAWPVLRQEFFPEAEDKKPLVFANFIEGGVHAKNNLDIQEYLVVSDDVSAIKKAYEQIGEILGSPGLGDEAGYVKDFQSNLEPLKILSENTDFKLSLDAAADQFYKNGQYSWEGHQLSREELREIYLGYLEVIPSLFSIEDPFAEDNFTDLPDLIVVGDDLTVTNSKRIEENSSIIGGVIIKPDQAGSLVATAEAIKAAKKNNIKTIVSHRAGETDDSFIISLAKACGADGVKIGAPARERLVKYDELSRLYS